MQVIITNSDRRRYALGKNKKKNQQPRRGKVTIGENETYLQDDTEHLDFRALPAERLVRVRTDKKEHPYR